MLKDDGASFSLSTTKWAIAASGQMVRDANKAKRVSFCERLIRDNDTFDDVIFSDECAPEQSLHPLKVNTRTEIFLIVRLLQIIKRFKIEIAVAVNR